MSGIFNDVISGVVVGLVLEGFAVGFVIVKMLPVMRKEIDDLTKSCDAAEKKQEVHRAIVERHSIEMAEGKLERENIKRDLEENKQTLKEINLQLKTAVDENTKAIVALETTIKILGRSLSRNKE